MIEPFVVRHREQLSYLLAEAAEIEHNLMCCYLYAGFSLKDASDGDLSPAELAAVDRWRASVRAVAVEEMTHLALVSNLLTAVGGAPHFARQNFPVAPGVHPARIVVELAPMDLATVDHFVFLERPEGVDLPDGDSFASPRAYVRGARTARLMPNAQDYATVGELYAAIRGGLESLARALGEDALFVGDPAAQVGADLISLPGLAEVRDLASALAAVDTIVRQGEGTSGHVEGSHYHRFRAIREEYGALLAARPGFAPARPVARNPVMRRPPTPQGKVWVNEPAAEEVLDLANAVYTFSLRLLCQGFGWAGEAPAKRVLLDGAIDAMFALGTVSTALTTLPASDDHPGVRAGTSFALLRAIAPLPHGGGEWAFLAERARELADACAAAERLAPALPRATRVLARVAEALAAERDRRRSPRRLPLAPTPAAPTAAPAAPTPAIEEAATDAVTLRFEGERCIHA